MNVRIAKLAVALCLVVGCQEADDTDAETDEVTETETGSSGGFAPCDEQPVITYDTFGRGFIASYCDGCHGSDVVNRQGAPEDAVFDTREAADVFADRILARAAPPDGSISTMPPVGGVPPVDAERLVVWLTCFP